jgi:hypothetical protein
MLNLQNPPSVEKQWSTNETPASGRSARDPEVRSGQRNEGRPMRPSIEAPYPHRFGEGPLTSGRPSIARRIFSTFTRFSIAVLIGVGATLGWQSYGDAVKQMLVARSPTLAWVLPASTRTAPVVAATSTDPMQQLAPLASNLDVVRRNVEQLAAKQEQMAQSMAAMQAVDEDIRQKMSSTPPAQPTPSIPQPKPRQARASQSSALQLTPVPPPPPPAGAQLSR